MRVAILGGTGGLGRGLALRLGLETEHAVVVGSRDPDRARRAAAAFADGIADHAGDRAITGGSVTGADNAAAVIDADVVIVAVPPEPAPEMVADLEPSMPADAVVVSTVVGIEAEGDTFRYRPPDAGSHAAAIANRAPDQAAVGAFQAVPAGPLAALDRSPGYDVPVVGDATAAVERVAGLIDDCGDLDGVPAGPLGTAETVERLALLLMQIGERTDRSGLGVQFV